MKTKSFLILFLLAIFLVMGVASDIFSAPPHPNAIEDYKAKGKLNELKARSEAMKKAGQDAPQQDKFPTTGNHTIVVLRIQFTDLSFNGTSTNTFYDNLFETGPSGNGMSWKKYYQDMSNNTLNLSFDVFGPFTASHGYAYYGANTGPGGNDALPATLVGEAITLADASVNFSQYNDGTGHVSVIVIHSGIGEEINPSTYADRIWSHRWTLEAGEYYGDGTGEKICDGMTINDYAIQPEFVLSAGDSTIGVFCHEFGHVLGLQDLYDYTYTTDGVGDWSLMAGGSNNGTNGSLPAPLLAWEKEKLNWITINTVTPLKSPQSVNINDIGTPEVDINTPPAPEVNINLSENIKIDGNNSFLVISLGVIAFLGILITLLVGLKKGLKNNIMLLMFFVLVLIPLSAFVYSCVLFGWEAPSSPTGLTASDGTYSDHISVTWNSSANTTLYRLYYSTSQSGTYAELGTGFETTSVNVTGVTAGTTYWFKAKAGNTYGLSGFSNADSGYMSTGGTPPSAPTGLTASDGTYPDKINVTWNSVSGATLYRLYYSTSQSGTYTEIGTGFTVTSVNVTGVPTGTTFWFKAKAENSYGLSDFSNADSGFASSVTGTGTQLFANTWEDGNLNGATQEWFWFYATPGTTYKIYTDDEYFTTPGDDPGTSNFDNEVGVYKADMTTSYTYTFPTSPSSGQVDIYQTTTHIEFVATENIVQVKVTGYNGATGPGIYWVKFTQNISGSVTLSDVETSDTAVKVILGDGGKQYYLIENKVLTAGTWAEGLPGAGLLICHIDEDFTILDHPNDNDHVHGVNIKEADGNDELWTVFGDQGQPGDTYKSPKTLTPTSTPNSNLNSDTVQNGGGSSGISITNISAVGSTMTFDVSD